MGRTGEATDQDMLYLDCFPTTPDFLGEVGFKTLPKARLLPVRPGTDPIKILQHKFYATQFFQDSDWLKIFRIQSECLKNFVE